MNRLGTIGGLILAVLVCAGCSGPEKPFASASILLTDAARARASGDLDRAAQFYRQGAVAAENLLVKHRGSTLAARVEAGDLHLGPYSLRQLRSEVLPRVGVWEASGGSVLAAAVRMIEGMEPSPEQAGLFAEAGVALHASGKSELSEAALIASGTVARLLSDREEQVPALVAAAHGRAATGDRVVSVALLREALETALAQPETETVLDHLEAVVDVCEEMGESEEVVQLLNEVADATLYLELPDAGVVLERVGWELGGMGRCAQAYDVLSGLEDVGFLDDDCGCGCDCGDEEGGYYDEEGVEEARFEEERFDLLFGLFEDCLDSNRQESVQILDGLLQEAEQLEDKRAVVDVIWGYSLVGETDLAMELAGELEAPADRFDAFLAIAEAFIEGKDMSKVREMLAQAEEVPLPAAAAQRAANLLRLRELHGRAGDEAKASGFAGQALAALKEVKDFSGDYHQVAAVVQAVAETGGLAGDKEVAVLVDRAVGAIAHPYGKVDLLLAAANIYATAGEKDAAATFLAQTREILAAPGMQAAAPQLLCALARGFGRLGDLAQVEEAVEHLPAQEQGPCLLALSHSFASMGKETLAAEFKVRGEKLVEPVPQEPGSAPGPRVRTTDAVKKGDCAEALRNIKEITGLHLRARLLIVIGTECESKSRELTELLREL